jgi:cyclase
MSAILRGSRAAAIVLTGGALALSPGAVTHAQQGGIEVLPVHGQVYMLAGPAGNAAIQVGPQGVVVVDTMREQDADLLIAAIRTVAGDRPIRFVIDTHMDPNHTGGNAKVSQAGVQLVAGNFAQQVTTNTAFIVAHENVLNAMSAPTGSEAPVPFAAWPTQTFFQAEKKMYFNGEGIQLLYQPAAHTDGDILVFFRGSDVISTGDIFVTTGYPEIDVKRGGSINGVIESLNRILDLAISDTFTEGGTRIVPGHGRICDEFEVLEYRDMVTIIRDRVQAMIKKKMSLEQVKASRPTLDWEPRYGSTAGSWTTAMFIDAIYQNLTPVTAPVRAGARPSGR